MIGKIKKGSPFNFCKCPSAVYFSIEQLDGILLGKVLTKGVLRGRNDTARKHVWKDSIILHFYTAYFCKTFQSILQAKHSSWGIPRDQSHL